MSLSRLTDEEVFNLAYDYHAEAINRKLKNNLQFQKNNEKFIGRCFMSDSLYILVIDSKSIDTRYVEALVFDKNINFKDKPVMRKMYSPEVAFKNIDFKGVRVESIKLLNIINKEAMVNKLQFTEISKEEYDKTFEQFFITLRTKVDNFLKEKLND